MLRASPRRAIGDSALNTTEIAATDTDQDMLHHLSSVAQPLPSPCSSSSSRLSSNSFLSASPTTSLNSHDSDDHNITDANSENVAAKDTIAASAQASLRSSTARSSSSRSSPENPLGSSSSDLYDSQTQVSDLSEDCGSDDDPEDMLSYFDADDVDEDQIYNAVDFISESDGDSSDDFEEEETRHILQDFVGDAIHNLGAPNCHHEGASFAAEMPYFADQMRRIVYSNLAEDLQDAEEVSIKSPIFGPFPISAPSPPPPTPMTTARRRVRFDDSALATPKSLPLELDSAFNPSSFEETMDEALQAYAEIQDAGDTTDEDEVPINTTKSPRALLHRPTWDMESLYAPPAVKPRSRCKRSLKRKACVPRVATWTVHPGKALAQSDENHKVVIMMPVNPLAQEESQCKNQARLPPSDQVTCHLKKPAETIADTSEHRFAKFADIDLITTSDSHLLQHRDAAASDWTMRAHAGRISASVPASLAGHSTLPDETNRGHLTGANTYVPANDTINDLRFSTANSDHESTDLDIMDYITFSSSSDEGDEDASVSEFDIDVEVVLDPNFTDTVNDRSSVGVAGEKEALMDSPGPMQAAIPSSPHRTRMRPSPPLKASRSFCPQTKSHEKPSHPQFGHSLGNLRRNTGLSLAKPHHHHHQSRSRSRSKSISMTRSTKKCQPQIKPTSPLIKSKSPVHVRRTNSGLALTRPATRGRLRSSLTPPILERKRKLSDRHVSGIEAEERNFVGTECTNSHARNINNTAVSNLEHEGPNKRLHVC